MGADLGGKSRLSRLGRRRLPPQRNVEGYTDNVGAPKSNRSSSEARAKSVVAALVAKGIAAARLTASGFGQERPVADNSTEEGRAKNRRVELVKP